MVQFIVTFPRSRNLDYILNLLIGKKFVFYNSHIHTHIPLTSGFFYDTITSYSGLIRNTNLEVQSGNSDFGCFDSFCSLGDSYCQEKAVKTGCAGSGGSLRRTGD